MEDNTFKKNYLKQVIFRVDFRPIFEFSSDNINSEIFQDIIKEEFPDIKFSEENEIIATFDEDNKFEEFNKNFICICWDKDHSKKLEITKQSITLSYNEGKYNSHILMLDDINLIKEILKEYKVNLVNQIGLRYINELTPESSDIKSNQWIKEELSICPFVEDNFKLLRNITRTEYKFEDFFINVAYGQFNLNYPSTNIKDDFVLDFDCITHIISETKELNEIFEKMHKIIKSLFFKNISNQFIEHLKGE